MNALYNHAVKQRNQLQNDLNKFESDLLSSSVSLQGSISATLVSFDRTIKQLDDYISRNSNINTNTNTNNNHDDRISKFKIKLDDLKIENKTYQNKFKELKTQYNKSQLFGSVNNNNNTNSTNTSSSSSENPFNDDNYLNKRNVLNNNNKNSSNNNTSNNIGTNYDKENLLPSFYENIQKEHSIFSRGNAQLDLILEMGNNSLQDLMDQNAILNNIQDKMNKTLKTLNVSQSTIDQINKRLFKDKLIFWIGLLLLFIGMYYILKLFK